MRNWGVSLGLAVQRPALSLTCGSCQPEESLAHHTARCLALANDTYRLTDLCLLHTPQVRGGERSTLLPRRSDALAWPAQVVAIACMMLGVEAPGTDVHAWAQRIPGVDPDAVVDAISELLRGYERPRLDAFACHIALAGDD